VTPALLASVAFTAAGLLLIRFRRQIARSKTEANEEMLGFLPRLFTVVTPSGVVLVACIFFFLALLGVVAVLIGAA
jgi:hypothetical protein